MTPQLILAIVGIFAAVGIGTAAAGMLWLQRTAPEHRRLQALTQPAVSGLMIDTQGLTDTPDPALARLSRLVPKSPKNMGRLQRRMTRAGYPQLSAAVYFSVAELVLPLVFFLIVILSLGLRYRRSLRR
jgi:hypothetical protein